MKIVQDLKPYPTYKSSCLNWLPGMPAHWRNEWGKWLLKQMKRPGRNTDKIVYGGSQSLDHETGKIRGLYTLVAK